MKPIIKQIDKANHFIVGYLFMAFCMIFLPIPVAFTTVMIAGFTKELWDDWQYENGFDAMDWAYTCAGALPMFVNYLI